MSLTNTAKPSTSITNATRPSFSELWSTISTTWAAETRTWLDMASVIDNTSKPSTSLTNVSKPS